jgi:2-hydroxychromene-2-carboxylate isomerase
MGYRSHSGGGEKRQVGRTNARPDIPVRAVAETHEVQPALRSNAEEAQAKGLGAPSFTTASGELFCGQDRLEEAFAWSAR